MSEISQGDALAQIHAEGGDSALKLVGDLMDRNAREYSSTMDMLYEGEKNAHEQTKQRLRDAHHELAVIRHRLAWIFGEVDDPFRDPWDLGA